MRRVIVESPYAGSGPWPLSVLRRWANIRYARRCVRDAVLRGEAPIASHLLFTQPGILRDAVAAERELGIAAGLAWGALADATVVYTDRGISGGMRAGIARAEAENRPVECRRLPGWPALPYIWPQGGFWQRVARVVAPRQEKGPLGRA